MEVEPEAPERVLDILIYLDANEVPEDLWEAKIRNRAARYTMVDDILYRRGYSTPLLRCTLFEEAQYVLAVMQVGYYWSPTLKDADEYVCKCTKCQEYSRVPHHPLEELILITMSWWVPSP
ncbi:uncharacterized protein LOC122304695 [Carya illinoinensis]|uniref:uncharacterized protein LOC122304695 n=1 Tax=Carya illinoinensis TaxID=32201 RepID=UPI001C71A33C|nr:uncharacterized protein LOC122304695 [Carya illinoinensis]